MSISLIGTRQSSFPQSFVSKIQGIPQAVTKTVLPEKAKNSGRLSAIKVARELPALNQEPRCKQMRYGQPNPLRDHTDAASSGECTLDGIQRRSGIQQGVSSFKKQEPVSAVDFQTRIRHEFIDGSGIDLELFNTAIAFLPDFQELLGGEFCSPLCEAFGWTYIRFGRQARRNSQAAVFLNEDDSVWQGKLDIPRIDKKKGEIIKYETPVGNGSQPYLPPVNQAIHQAIAKRYNLEMPLPGESFWGWVANHSEIPIVLTEGGKKALCLLSHGYVAISLYGVDAGAKAKDAEENRCKPYLIPGLLPFLADGREVVLAFDQDEKAETRSRVKRSIIRLSRLIEKAGCPISIAIWDGQLGKGIDDLIVNQGVLAWTEVYQSALPFKQWTSHNRLLQQLTYTPSLVAYTPDLSLVNFEQLPDTGILGIQSAKATGKTKLTERQVQDEKQVLVATHRIALGQNLCRRLNVHWRSDLDKANGEFIYGQGYTLRVGFCVDSLLAIDPNKFRGCVLVIDEVVQVLRHMLTSSTCRKDGKLPAILARLRELVQVARLVIVADADLNNATLDYLKTLRGDGEPVYLLVNQFKPEGYPCDFILSPNASAVTARLLKTLTERKRIFILTDSKNQSKRLALQCLRIGLREEQILLINSETSGGEQEQTFIKNPDEFLAQKSQILVVVVSPSVCTGVSIESHFFDEVFGIFGGASLTDADMAQGLMRVRETIPRTVWCAETGGNFCRFSRSTLRQEVLQALQTRTNWSASLIRSNLREDVRGAIEAIDWNNDPHIRLFAQITADTNYSMWNLRSALLARLRLEGHSIAVVDMESDPIIQAAMKEARAQILQLEAEAVANARLLSNGERAELEKRDFLTPDERLSLHKTALAAFYCVNAVTPEMVLDDKAGLRRSRLLALEYQLCPEVAQRQDIQALERQMKWYRGICPWDISIDSLKRETRDKLGLDRYLNQNFTWTKYDNAVVAQLARGSAKLVQLILNLSNLDKLSDTQIVHQLLSQMGVKLQFHWSRSVPGHEGEKLRVYQIDADIWQQDMDILSRRLERRQQADPETETLAGSPPSLDKKENQGGDPKKEAPDSWLTPENIENVSSLIKSADGDSEAIALLKQMIPEDVFKHLNCGELAVF